MFYPDQPDRLFRALRYMAWPTLDGWTDTTQPSEERAVLHCFVSQAW